MYSYSGYESFLTAYAIAIIIVAIIVGIICANVSQSIAKQKGYEDSKTYFWLGLLLGIIGVVIAACLTDKTAAKNAAQNVAKVNAPNELLTYKELLDMGAITQDEFEMKKREILNR